MSSLEPGQEVSLTVDFGAVVFVTAVLSQGPPESVEPVSYINLNVFKLYNTTQAPGEAGVEDLANWGDLKSSVSGGK